MRRAALLTTLLWCCMASRALAGDEFSSSRTAPPKGSSEAQPLAPLSGGETFATATEIPALPYTDSGTTCGFANNYLPCVSDFHSAPDVVYRFVATTDLCVDISLCGSTYDAQISVYANDLAHLVVCRDDDAQCGLQPHLKNLALTAGNTYYIVLDGYENACGAYTLTVQACPPPPVCDACPPGARIENELACADGYVDAINGGCNSTPHRFTPLPCAHSVTVCGTYGTYDQNITRDTDWYQLGVTVPSTITATVEGHGLAGTVLGIVDTACPPNILASQLAPTEECETITCTAAVPGGSYRIVVTNLFDNTPCGSTYVLTVSGHDCPVTAAPASSWGTLKGLYR
jgi:hypothetical protein